MVDREARLKMQHVIESFMDDHISDREFFKKMASIAGTSSDPVVRFTLDEIDLCFGDTSTNNLICVTRHGWQVLNRFRLLLVADTEIEEIVERHWSIRQLFAASIAVLWILAAVSYANFLIFLSLSLCAALGTYILEVWRMEDWDKRLVGNIVSYEEEKTYPFRSPADILSCRRTVPEFVYWKFRKEVEQNRTKRHPVLAWVLNIGNITIFTMPRWLNDIGNKVFVFFLSILFLPFLVFFAPLITFWQMLPETGRATRLHVPGENAG